MQNYAYVVDELLHDTLLPESLHIASLIEGVVPPHLAKGSDTAITDSNNITTDNKYLWPDKETEDET